MTVLEAKAEIMKENSHYFNAIARMADCSKVTKIRNSKLFVPLYNGDIAIS